MDIEYRIVRPEGEIRWVRVRGFQVRDAANLLIRHIGIVSDITESKRTAEARDRLAAILEATSDLVSISDPAGNFIYLNRAGRLLLDVDPHEDITKTAIADFVPNPASHPILKEGIPAAIRSGIWSGETVLLSRRGQEIPVSQVILAHHTPGGHLESISTIMRDISERKRLEARLFQQSQKMETVGKLAGGVAHEFNSILTAIIGQSELLLGGLPPGSPSRKMRTRLRERGSCRDPDTATPGLRTQTNPAAGNSRSEFHPPGNDGFFASFDAPGHGSQLRSRSRVESGVNADAGQIEHVIMSLALNARDAMPHGGKLMVETANVSIESESVGPLSGFESGRLRHVRDRGYRHGDERSCQGPRFRTVFYDQGSRRRERFGVVDLLRHRQAKRRAHQRVYGAGTRHDFQDLSAAGGVTGEGGEAGVRPHRPLPRGTETILLVEDDADLREMAATLLRQLGYTVLTAANGVAALTLKRNAGHIDLLFTDVVMPHMSGKELADRMQALHAHTRVLFTSGLHRECHRLSRDFGQRRGVVTKAVYPFRTGAQAAGSAGSTGCLGIGRGLESSS
ncbi:MAG: response regulator [Chthoniobacter sp.]